MRDGAGVSYYRFIFDPVFVVSFLVMVINDIFLRKTGIAPLFFGKLSDAAILIFLPAVGALLICFIKYLAFTTLWASSTIRPAPYYHLTQPVLLISVIFTGTVFTMIKASDFFNDLYIRLINSVNILHPLFPRLGSIKDPTDLFMLPALAVSYCVLRKYVSAPL